MIDRATLADLEPIRRLWNDVIRDTTITFTSTPKDAATIAEIIDTQPVFVARDGAKCLGFSTYSQFRGGDGYRLTQEYAIYLTQAARGRGLGRGLLQAVERHARDAGNHAFIAGISGENVKAIKFHEAMGFTHCGRLREVGHKFGRFLDLVLMQKQL